MSLIHQGYIGAGDAACGRNRLHHQRTDVIHPGMIATDDDVKRVLQQMYDAAKDMVGLPTRKLGRTARVVRYLKGLLRKPRPKRWAFGSSIAFITTTFTLTRQLTADRRLPASVVDAQKRVVADAISRNELRITQPDTTPRGTTDPDETNFRHLRNSFSHANWTYSSPSVRAGSMAMTLEDRYQGQTNWAAIIGFADLVSLAERLLIETFNGMP